MTAARDGTYFRACNLCEAICGLEITIRDGKISDLRGDAEDPLSHGHICPKGSALADLHADPDRLKTPLLRDGNERRAIAWDDAYALVATRLKEIVATHGGDAVAIYLGNPAVHNSGTLLSFGAFLKSIPTKNRFSATSADQLPHHLVAAEMFGHPLLLPIPDVDRTLYFLALGANPLVSNGSIMTAPGMRDRLKAVRARGGKVVAVDPRRSETAAVADEHLFIRPGTDAAFLLGLLNAIAERDGIALDALEPFCDGAGEIRALAERFPAERVAPFCGIDAATIRRIANEFAAAPNAVVYGRMGVSTQPFGTLCQWLLTVINAISGNLDTPGGAMWPLPAFDNLSGVQAGKRYAGRWHSRVRGLPEFDGEFPVATMADEMLTPGPGQIRALVTIAGNPVLSTPGGARLDEALANLEFVVSIDPYLNETTRHAHVVLPPAIGLENEHYDVIFHHFAVRNTARYNEAIFPISEEQRYDWQIFDGLKREMTGKTGAPPRERVDAALEHGPRKTNLAELMANPHGIDYGPMTPVMPERLLTADGRIRLAPPAFLADVPRLEAEFDRPAPELVLIGRRQLRSNNSWMHNAPRLMRGPDRCTLLVNPADAERRGIKAGDSVEIRSRAGAVVAPAELSDEVMPGVVSLPHGFGHGREGARQSVAEQKPGASLNDVTDELRLDELSGNAAFNGVPVEIRVLAAATA